MDVTQCILVIASCIVLTQATADSLTIKSTAKRSAPEEPLELAPDYDEVDKRVFRYGKRGGLMRYGKRPAVFRYGKRDSYEDYFDSIDDLDKRAVFRYGKRGDLDEDDVKRLFRLGRSGADTAEKRVFRYGKRDDESIEAEKRKQFRFGKRGAEAVERPTRNEPHLPFRYGDD